jgi:hypothetical protein
VRDQVGEKKGVGHGRSLQVEDWIRAILLSMDSSHREFFPALWQTAISGGRKDRGHGVSVASIIVVAKFPDSMAVSAAMKTRRRHGCF